MIETLTGKYQTAQDGEEFIILNVAGVGYKVFCAAAVEKKAMEVSQVTTEHPEAEEITLLIHEHINIPRIGPSSWNLYGFLDFKDRFLFRELLKVDKVGPSKAMGVMGIGSSDQIIQAIRMGSEKYLQRGAGEKTAQAIILELGKKLN